ncbi:hypothetical protein [Jeotgalibacillus marinus]|uniref:Uncharacterized protein n=1 Tax=Jeotgalibacillus marinus TaxID=86667 RepID=A0ABV3Q5S3_9BACL
MKHWRQMPTDQLNTIQSAQQNFLMHSALDMHYERLKMAYANNHSEYYRYAELQYYHKSRAFHFKSYFSAESLIQ